MRLVDGAWAYETRDLSPVVPQPTGNYIAYARQLTDRGYSNTLLSEQGQYMRELLFEPLKEVTQT